MSIRDQFINDGFVVMKSHIDEALINNLRVKCVSVFRRMIRYHKCHDMFDLYNKQPEAFKNCGKALQGLPNLYKLMMDDRIHDLVCNVINEPVVTTKPLVHFHHQRFAERDIDWAVPPHQDAASVQSSLNSVVIWIPLVDCTSKEIGPLRVAKGSHKGGSQWTGFDKSFGLCTEYNDSDFIDVPMKMGDVLMFSQMTVHASGFNTTFDKPRWSVTLRFGDLSSKDWIERNYHNPYKYVPQTDSNYYVSYDDMETAFDNQEYSA